MKEHASLPPQQNTYVPVIAIERATFKHSASKLAVALRSAPDQICGQARRVGYAGKQEHDPALYRLKIKSRAGQPTITLPGFYIVDNACFIEYEQWRQTNEQK